MTGIPADAVERYRRALEQEREEEVRHQAQKAAQRAAQRQESAFPGIPDLEVPPPKVAPE